LEPGVRKIALTVLLTVGLPTLLGFLYAAWGSFQSIISKVESDQIEIFRLTLLGFVGSWLAWYALLALYLDRYLFPAVFVGSLFTSGFLYQLTFKFDVKQTLQNASAVFFRSRKRQNFGALFALLLLILLVPLSLQYMVTLYLSQGVFVAEVTDYIESITGEDELIETYESELYFLLDRRYHYPPDKFNVQIVSHAFIGNNLDYDYDPLAEDPDYLVIGQFARLSKIYGPVLASGEFQLLDSIQGYDVYRRTRP
jgi:hypothetical protein